MLCELGYEVALVSTITDAQQRLEQVSPAIAILDVNIQGERSYGLAHLLAARRIPVIFATGYGDAEHPRELSTTTTLTKPYNMDDLRQALASALGN